MGNKLVRLENVMDVIRGFKEDIRKAEGYSSAYSALNALEGLEYKIKPAETLEDVLVEWPLGTELSLKKDSSGDWYARIWEYESEDDWVISFRAYAKTPLEAALKLRDKLNSN